MYKPTNKIQRLYLIITIVTLVSGQLLTQLYRPYVYKNKINDFGFADTIGSLVSVIGFCFFVWSFKNYSDRDKNKQIILATIIYTVLWESLGILGIHGTFDWKDIAAGIISGAITYGLKSYIEKKFKRNVMIENRVD